MSPSSLLLSGKAMSSLPNPLWTFATFQLWGAPPLPTSPPALRSNYCLCFATVFAFALPQLSLRFLRFFWQRKMLNTIFAVDLRFSTFFVYFGAHLLLLLLLLLHLLVFLCFLSLGRSPHSISPVMAAFSAFFYASLCNLMSTFSWAFSLARRFVCDSICVIPKCDCSCQSNVPGTRWRVFAVMSLDCWHTKSANDLILIIVSNCLVSVFKWYNK